MAVTSEEIDPAFVRLLIWRSLYLDPIDLANPAPLRVFYHEDAPGYVVFVRDESQPAAQPEPAAEDAGKPGADPKSGRVVIDVSIQPDEGERSQPFLKKSEKRAAARQTLKATVSDKYASPHDTLADSTAVDVYAKDRRGHTYPAVHVSRYSFGDDSKRNVITFSSDVARFVINSLSPGTYTVYAKVLGYMMASKDVTVTAGKTTPVTFALVPQDGQEDHKPKKQPGPVDATWIPPYYWYGRLYPVESYVRWPWPPDPKVAREFGPVVGPPPPEVDIWIEQWVDYLQAQYPDVALDPGDVQLLIDKSHTPEKIASEPYAYLTFGESGPYLPVVLTSKDMVLDRSVSVAKAGLRGVDADMVSDLASVGVATVEALTAVWTSLVEDVLGVGGEAARGLIESARDEVVTLQGGLQMFSGVDKALDAALKDKAKVDSAEALANADPRSLVEAVGADTLTPNMAQILVDQARSAVPKSAWSLAEPSLGLKEHEVAELARLGITTKGALKKLADNEPSRISVALGISEDQARALGSGIVVRDALTTKADRQAEAPVTKLVSVDRATGASLAAMGFGTVGRLAAADAGALAAAFGGDQARAAAAIAAAKFRLGR